MSDISDYCLTSTQIEDLVLGYKLDGTTQARVCLFCGKRFEEGIVYPSGDRFLLPERAAAEHVEADHGGSFRALMARGEEAAGLPAVQARVLALLYEGKNDKEIALALDGKSGSTIRNHRFNLRKREEQARVFLALMRLLDRKGSGAGRFVDFPAGMPAMDERAAVSPPEAAEIEAKYVMADQEGGQGMVVEEGFRLRAWPKKQKEKLILLRRIAGLFQEGRKYTETEVNFILAPVWSDYVTVRRYLIEYKFLDRKPDGREYWKT